MRAIRSQAEQLTGRIPRSRTLHAQRSRQLDPAMTECVASAMTDPCLGSATALAAALRAREIGARELLERYLDRVERLNGRLNAVVTLDVERARAAADRADRE